MKKLLTIILAFSLCSLAFAQDLSSATELYNQGATALNKGEKTQAVKLFEKALLQAEDIGAEAEELAYNCKNAIPTVYLAIGKELAAAKKYDEAIKILTKAKKLAEKYGQSSTSQQAAKLIPQLYVQQGNDCLREKDYKGSIEFYNKAVTVDPNQAMAYLRMGNSYMRLGQESKMEESLNKANELGLNKQASQMLSKYFLLKSRKLLKAKKNKEAIVACDKSLEAMKTPLAFFIKGQAAMQIKSYDVAIESLESFLALSPNDRNADNAIFQLAMSCQSKKMNAKACGYYKQIQGKPKFAEYAKAQIKILKCK
ncbi:MAG: tetratricopeptide repeat protein [Bacteroidales bacterium]